MNDYLSLGGFLNGGQLIFIFYFISWINLSFYLTIAKIYVEEQDKLYVIGRTSCVCFLWCADYMRLDLVEFVFLVLEVDFGVWIIRGCRYIVGIMVYLQKYIHNVTQI